MVVVTAFALAFPSIIIVSALTLNNPSLMLPNSTLANITSSNYIHTCDGSFYGYDLNPMSCIEALTQIDASSTTQQTYGPRLAGRFDVKLPKRYISLSGLCIIEPRVKNGKSSARASLQEVESAAAYIIDECVNGEPSQGGELHNIGGDNNLNIIVEKYEPQVQCSGAVSPSLLSSCQNIVDTMPASRDFTTWGPPDDPLAVVKLPLTYYSLDRRCKLSIRTDGLTDTYSRYQFWTTAVALTGICVRSGRVGVRDHLGLSDHLSMEIGPA
ncbi:hypothetical protein IMSHALPRED_007149 [Imshaugia aleurites]|uniref:Uncharacterized protein n=1 Tax=Imshaugia aleurites TaxID=172621 RepID=A0A8H3FJP1_9LECA|nr:hypothetical protein IMSHALPRED_007149 [Imshaugia aleurites]